MIIHKTNTELEAILGQINSAVEAKVVLPVKVCYKIVKNRLAIEQALVAFREVRNDIIKKYADETGRITEQDKNFDKVTFEVLKVAGEYTDVEICEIDISELGEKELPLNVVSALGFMMK